MSDGAPIHDHRCPWLIADDDSDVECTCGDWANTFAGKLERIRREAAALGAADLVDRADMTKTYMQVRAMNALEAE